MDQDGAWIGDYLGAPGAVGMGLDIVGAKRQVMSAVSKHFPGGSRLRWFLSQVECLLVTQPILARGQCILGQSCTARPPFSKDN